MYDSDLATLAVHAGRHDFTQLGVHAAPIDLSSTYPVPDPEAGTASYDAMAAGGTPVGSAIYARLYNPTVARVEEAIAELEGAEACVAFASGMAATTAVTKATCRTMAKAMAVATASHCHGEGQGSGRGHGSGHGHGFIATELAEAMAKKPRPLPSPWPMPPPEPWPVAMGMGPNPIQE